MSSDSRQEERGAVWLALVGLPIGFLGSLCGIGGGLFASPLLHYRKRLPLREATGTALVLVLATTAAATLTEALRADSALNAPVIGAAILGSWVGSGLGFRFSERVPERSLRAIFAVALTYASWRLFSGGGAESVALGEAAVSPQELLLCTVVGLAGGFAAPVLGVGGGLFLVPGLYLVVGTLDFDGARACSLATGVVSASRSVVLKHRAGRVFWRFGIALALGALVGSFSGVLSLKALVGLVELGRRILAGVLLFFGLRFGLSLLRAPGRVSQA